MFVCGVVLWLLVCGVGGGGGWVWLVVGACLNAGRGEFGSDVG